MIKKEEFLSKVEELKKVNREEPNVELVENGMIEELGSLREILSKTSYATDDKYLMWRNEKNGYINGMPFAIFNRKPDEDRIVLVTPSKIVDYKPRYSKLGMTYSERNIDGEYIYDISSDCMFNRTFSVGYDSKAYKGDWSKKESSGYRYQENISKTNSLLDVWPSDELKGISNELKKLGFAAELPDTFMETKDIIKIRGYWQEYHGDNVPDDFDNNVEYENHLLATYLSNEYYLEGGLPYYINFGTYLENDRRVSKWKGFMLLKDGRYVDTDLYVEKGLLESIVTIEEIKQLLKEHNLSLDVSEKLRECMISEDIPTLDVKAAITKSRNR